MELAFVPRPPRPGKSVFPGAPDSIPYRYNTVRKNSQAARSSCKGFIQFLQEQRDKKAAKIAVNASVVGIPFYMLFSAGRSIHKRLSGTIHLDRTEMAQVLKTRATPRIELDRTERVRGRGEQHFYKITRPGCRQAQAHIGLLTGDLDLSSPNDNPYEYGRTLACLFDPTGWKVAYDQLSAGMIW